MNSSTTAYTPLESLLLFQSLATYGVDPPVFNRISDLLKRNPHVTADAAFDSGRLSPDALRDLCLNLLKDELRRDLTGGYTSDHDGVNGEGLPNSRKRKAPSPVIPSIREATQHAHLIPKLVDRLYARYSACIIEDIRREERLHNQLKRELREIEQHEWDERLQQQAAMKGIADGSLAATNGESDQRLPKPKETVVNPVVQRSAHEEDAPPPPGHKKQEDGPPVRETKASPSITTPAKTLPTPAVVIPPSKPNGHSEPAVSLPPRPVQPPLQPLHPPAVVATDMAKDSPPVSQPQPPSTATPQLQTQPSGPGFRPTPALHQSPYAAPRPTIPATTAAPPSHPAIATGNGITTPSRTPAPRPIHAPTLLNASTTPAGAGSPVPAPRASVAPHLLPPHPPHQQPVPVYREQPLQRPPSLPHAPLVPSGVPPQQLAQQQAQPPHAPNNRNFYPPYPGTPSPYAQPGNPPSLNSPHFYPPHRGGYMLPPFQVTPQTPQDAPRIHQHQQQTAPQLPHTPTPNGQKPGPPLATAAPKTPATVPARPTVTALAQPPHQPYPLSVQARRTFGTPIGDPRTPRRPLLSLQTPRSDTRWKASATAAPPSPKRAPSVSPIDDVGPSERFSGPSRPATKPATKGRGRRSVVAKDEPVQSNENAAQEAPQTQPTRSVGRPRGKRGVSAASSIVASSAAGRTRSQSIVSHVEGAFENETPATCPVKTEPSTPAALAEDDEMTAEPSPSAGQPRRRFGKTATTQSIKRKRSTRDTSDGVDSDGANSMPGLQNIVAPRHFSRMCNPIMNDILSHKHASLFSHPVKEKDAEGYKDIIRRPQDLKSIRMAISSGAKAVSASVAAENPASSPGGVGGNVSLPLSADMIPPKAIVNAGQLERELMRMFANAVMFNPGEEGVVKDAREMFNTVQESVSNWRSAERTTEAKRNRFEEDTDELAGDDELPTASKRRKQ